MTEIKFKNWDTWMVAYDWCLNNLRGDQWAQKRGYTLLFVDSKVAVMVGLRFS